MYICALLFTYTLYSIQYIYGNQDIQCSVASTPTRHDFYAGIHIFIFGMHTSTLLRRYCAAVRAAPAARFVPRRAPCPSSNGRMRVQGMEPFAFIISDDLRGLGKLPHGSATSTRDESSRSKHLKPTSRGHSSATFMDPLSCS